MEATSGHVDVSSGEAEVEGLVDFESIFSTTDSEVEVVLLEIEVDAETNILIICFPYREVIRNGFPRRDDTPCFGPGPSTQKTKGRH